MDTLYEELKESVGTLDTEVPEYLLASDEGVHLIIRVFSNDNMKTVLDAHKTLIDRGAERGKDYCISGYKVERGVELVIHTLRSWLSTEDVSGKYSETWVTK